MTQQKSFKRLVRRRMVETGESYTTAAVQVARMVSGDIVRSDASAGRPLLRIAFVGWLGGRGTSVQALYTAQALAELGLNVTVLDCHPMLDLVGLRRVEPNLPFDIKPLPAPDVATTADRVAAGSDVVVLDAPALTGANAAIAYSCIEYADEIVVPVPAHEREARQTMRIASQLHRVRPDARTCALLWDGRANSRSTAVARTLVLAEGLDVLDPVVNRRTAYSAMYALLAHVEGDAFPAVAAALVARHNQASDRPLGHSEAEKAASLERLLRRKRTPLTPKQRRHLWDTLRHGPPRTYTRSAELIDARVGSETAS